MSLSFSWLFFCLSSMHLLETCLHWTPCNLFLISKIIRFFFFSFFSHFFLEFNQLFSFLSLLLSSFVSFWISVSRCFFTSSGACFGMFNSLWSADLEFSSTSWLFSEGEHGYSLIYGKFVFLIFCSSSVWTWLFSYFSWVFYNIPSLIVLSSVSIAKSMYFNSILFWWWGEGELPFSHLDFMVLLYFAGIYILSSFLGFTFPI